MVAEHEAVSYGPFDLEFVAVNHSIPDAMAVFVRTAVGSVLATGDFKMDSLPIDGRITDLRSFARFADEGVDLFCVDSTNAEVPGMIVGLYQHALGAGVELFEGGVVLGPGGEHVRDRGADALGDRARAC